MVRASRARELREQATLLARCGFRVIRMHGVHDGACGCSRGVNCPTPGKHPIQKGWQTLATSDPYRATLIPWRNGDNIGAACGDGLAVLDLDRHRPEADGFNSLAELEHIHSPLPSGPRSHTGGGGLHLFFRYPRELQVHSIRIGPGLDLLGEGKLVVLPPSMHASGNPYRWEAGSAPWEIELPLLPRWLVDLLAPPLPEFDPRLHEIDAEGASRSRTALPLEQLLEQQRVPVTGPHDWRGQKLWLWRDWRARCPFGGDHDAAAFFLIQFRNGAVKAACFHNSCGSGANRWREFRARYLA